MIAVTCSACRLRFEASAVERRIHGTGIMCPACDGGEPIVLDLQERAPAPRLQVAPPPLDPAKPASFAPSSPAMNASELERLLGRDLPDRDLEDIRGASPAGAPILPIYVDLEDPSETPERSSLFGSALASGGLVVALFLLAVSATWQGTGSPWEAARTKVVGLLAPFQSSLSGADFANGARDEELTTASIPAAPVKLSIARVSTELAETDGGRILSVRTDVRNDGEAAVAAPTLRIAIRSEDGTVLHRWTTEAPSHGIDPGETRAFLATTRRIPEGAGDVKVDFAAR